MNAAIASALAGRASGTLSDADVESIAHLDAMLDGEKVATPMPLSQEVVSVLRQGALYGGLSALAGLGVHGVAQGGKMLHERITKGRDLDRILAVYPHLKDYPRKEIELAYNSMRHMNPHVAKDPLTGGTLLGQMLRSRDASNPKSLRFEPDLALNLMKLRPEDRNTAEEIVREGVQSGMASAVQELSRGKERAAQNQFMMGEADRKHQRDIGMEQMKTQQRAGETAAERAYRASESAADRLHRRTEAVRDRAAKIQGQVAAERFKDRMQGIRENDRRGWETTQKGLDRAERTEQAVMTALLNKAGPDILHAPIHDAAGNVIAYDIEKTSPQISDVVRRMYGAHPYLQRP